MKKQLETKRLILRPWIDADAESLYEYAKDPRVGPIAGWPVHTSVENSKEIIRDVLSADETYAVTLKNDDRVVGSIGLMIGEKSNLEIPDDEAEIGYWIGVPYWGQGLIPEAVQELMRYAFEDLGMKKLWCGYFDGNENSKRVGEKSGFGYHRTEEKEWPLINATKTQHITCITKNQWVKKRLIIRLETPNDYETVERLTYTAFSTMQKPGRSECDEHLLVRKMRSVPTFVPELAYVAEQDGCVVGNIMYTKSKVISGNDAEYETITFGPVSVLPEYQKQGIGAALIRYTLGKAKLLGYKAVLITGHPEYYPKFGFAPAEKYGITMPDGTNIDAFMALELYEDALANIRGTWQYDPVFEIDKNELAEFNKKYCYE